MAFADYQNALLKTVTLFVFAIRGDGYIGVAQLSDMTVCVSWEMVFVFISLLQANSPNAIVPGFYLGVG